MTLPAARVVSHPSVPAAELPPAPPPAAVQARPAAVYTGPPGPAAAALRAYAARLPRDQESALRWLAARSSSGALSMLRAVAMDIEAEAAELERRERR